jgi:hypothetical protein
MHYSPGIAVDLARKICAERANHFSDAAPGVDIIYLCPVFVAEEDLKAFIAESHRLGMRVLLDMVYLHCGPTAVLMLWPIRPAAKIFREAPYFTAPTPL